MKRAVASLFIIGSFLTVLRAETDPLQKVWSDYPNVSSDTRALLSQPIQKAHSQNLPTELLVNRLREGLTKGVPAESIRRRLEILRAHLSQSQTLMRQSNLAIEPDNAACIQGLATLFELGLSSSQVLEVRRLWPNLTCPNLIKALEWNLTVEKEGIKEKERYAVLKKAISANLIDKLPYLWVRGRNVGLSGRQILNVIEKGVDDGLTESQILVDFDRVSELLELEKNR